MDYMYRLIVFVSDSTKDLYNLTTSAFQSIIKQIEHINGQIINLSCEVQKLKNKCKCSLALAIENEDPKGKKRSIFPSINFE